MLAFFHLLLLIVRLMFACARDCIPFWLLNVKLKTSAHDCIYFACGGAHYWTILFWHSELGGYSPWLLIFHCGPWVCACGCILLLAVGHSNFMGSTGEMLLFVSCVVNLFTLFLFSVFFLFSSFILFFISSS